MGRFIAVFALLLGLASTAAADLHYFNETLARLPACATRCFTDAVLESTCAPTNQTCLCGDASGVQAAALDCIVFKACSVRDEHTAQNVMEQTCGVQQRNMQDVIRFLNWFAMAASGFVTAIRIAMRVCTDGFTRPSTRYLWWDDYSLVAAWFISLPLFFCIGFPILGAGLGRDIWTSSPEQIDTYFFYFKMVCEPAYFITFTLVRNSFCLLFVRVFCRGGIECYCLGRLRVNLRTALWATLAFNVATTVVFILITVFECNPISLSWQRWDGEHEYGMCLSNRAIALSNAGINIACDIWTLYLPLSQVSQLNLDPWKKIGVCAMFGVGILVTLVSVMRLKFLLTFGTSRNSTWDDFSTVIWSVMEWNFGIICACMPAIRHLVLRIIPRQIRLVSERYSSTYRNSTSGGGAGSRASRMAFRSGGAGMSSGGGAARCSSSHMFSSSGKKHPPSSSTARSDSPEYNIELEGWKAAAGRDVSHYPAAVVVQGSLPPDEAQSTTELRPTAIQWASNTTTNTTGIARGHSPPSPPMTPVTPLPPARLATATTTRPPLERRVTPDFFRVAVVTDPTTGRRGSAAGSSTSGGGGGGHRGRASSTSTTPGSADVSAMSAGACEGNAVEPNSPLDPELVPSKFAQSGDLAIEQHLARYVQLTKDEDETQYRTLALRFKG